MSEDKSDVTNVTAVQIISNGYAATLKFTNVENAGNNRDIPALSYKEVSNAWIPWCDSEAQFPSRHMKIEAANLTYYIWQQGNSIRCTRDGWQSSAPTIGGNSGIRQKVNWTIGVDGSITQFRES